MYMACIHDIDQEERKSKFVFLYTENHEKLDKSDIKTAPILQHWVKRDR